MDVVILCGIYYTLTVFQVNFAVIVSLFILLPRPIITHSTAKPTGKEVGEAVSSQKNYP
jgi:hypothetical protein